MTRFSINNRFSPVTLEQFRTVADRLDSSLRAVRPTITSEVILTTSRSDYYGYGSLSVSIPKTEEALERRERCSLQDLDNELWVRSFETGLYINDNSVVDPYMVCLITGLREPKNLFFFGQSLDSKSQEVFDSFKKAGLLQKVGDGFSKKSKYAVFYSSFRVRE